MGLVDVPNSRSSHAVPTPKGGGIGILGAFLACAASFDLSPFFWGPIFVLSVVSLIGDRIDIHPVIRLIIQFGAAFIVLAGLFHDSSLLVTAAHHFPVEIIGLVLIGCGAALFMVGTANFYNFMDGINGIAALTGVVAFSLLAAYGIVNNIEYEWVVFCICLALACLGFLPFNFPSARVFMGDVGSVLLGFVYAVIVFIMSDSLKTFSLLSGFLFTFYADELITMVERIKDGQSLTTPHRRHLYQVLANEAGISHWKVSAAYAISQLGVGLLFWKASRLGTGQFLFTILMVACLFMFTNIIIKNRYLKSSR